MKATDQVWSTACQTFTFVYHLRDAVLIAQSETAQNEPDHTRP